MTPPQWTCFYINSIRSLASLAMFYVTFILWAAISLPLLLGPKRWLWKSVLLGSRYLMFIIKCLGITVQVRGTENIPALGGCILAMKHQSSMETLLLLHLLRRKPVFVMKRELMWLPLFGWFAKKVDMIGLKQGERRPKAVQKFFNKVKKIMDAERMMVVFPEGERRPIGAEPHYRRGVSHIYHKLGVTVIPVALNTGFFWPRHPLRIHPGKAIVEFLPAIAPGLNQKDFQKALVKSIEEGSDRLALETLLSPNPPPLPKLGQSYAEKLISTTTSPISTC